MIWKFLKSPTLRLMERKLAEAEECIIGSQGMYGPANGLTIIRPSLILALRSSSSVIYSKISNDGISPERLIHAAILKLAEQNLLSGQHHVYRGKLSSSGLSLMALWNLCLSELLRLGATSETEAGITREWLSEELSGIG